MLYLPSGSARVHRLHAPFVTEKEIAAVVEFWKSQAAAEYVKEFTEAPREEREASEGGEAGDGELENDPLYNDAVRLVVEFGKASTSLLQRRLRIGYGRAAHLIDLMERDGIVGAADGPKPREVLKRPDWISEIEESMR
jgi:S-DNA-T family DNA segregation ATPase FtsK/SpoIIIE